MVRIIKNVAVVGAGIMGQGIAQSVAMAGYPVILYDVSQSILDQARTGIIHNLDKGITLGKVTPEQKDHCLENISLTHQIMEVVADLVIEAIVEDLKIKQDLFSKLESINPTDTIFATNTSSIPITRMASALKIPERLAGLHFFNPAHIMKLVEIIQGNATDAEVTELLTGFSKSLGKVPVKAKDAPGFIVNRVARHYYLESLNALEERVADHQVIDELLEGYGFKMGPFRLMDLIGIDTNLAVTRSMFRSFHYLSRFRPSRIQEDMVESGYLGRKSGKGFYSYGL
jgi:3-hydroxybutyryl-CoA dehydrogenase